MYQYSAKKPLNNPNIQQNTTRGNASSTVIMSDHHLSLPKHVPSHHVLPPVFLVPSPVPTNAIKVLKSHFCDVRSFHFFDDLYYKFIIVDITLKIGHFRFCNMFDSTPPSQNWFWLFSQFFHNAVTSGDFKWKCCETCQCSYQPCWYVTLSCVWLCWTWSICKINLCIYFFTITLAISLPYINATSLFLIGKVVLLSRRKKFTLKKWSLIDLRNI